MQNVSHETKSKLSEEKKTLPPPILTPELIRWLHQAKKDEKDAEEATPTVAGPSEDFPLENAGFDACEFQLANGNDVKVVFARFWERIRYQDWREGARPAQYFAIKVYSTEDTLPRSMAIHCEFRAKHDFSLLEVPNLWEWLNNLISERQFAKYNWLEDFIEELAEKLAEFSDAGQDAVEHVEYIPEITDPASFDKVDDSMFNDQNEGEADAGTK